MILEFDKWQGKNLNYFDNTCLGGPSGIKPYLMTSAFMVIPYVVHLSDAGKYFKDEVSIAVPIICGLILLGILILMAIATFMDAGIIPRNIIDNYHINIDNSKRKRYIVHMGVIKKLAKCYSCLIVKPYRSSHCPDCDNCVLRFDHHCPWIGNCVGLRNYKYFFSFLTLMNLFCFYLVTCSIYHIVKISHYEISELDINYDEINVRNYINFY